MRFLVQPDSPANEARHLTAAALFAAVERGEAEATTSEAVLAEVAHVLASKRQYSLPAETISAYLAPLIRLRGLKLPRGRKRLYLRAFGLWTAHPRLGFVDALTTATVEGTDLRLAMFDREFQRLPNIRQWSDVIST